MRPVTHVRSSALVTAQGLLRAMGKSAAYEEGLAPAARPAVLAVVPGAWIPVETALAHHRAIDSLRLPPLRSRLPWRPARARRCRAPSPGRSSV